MLFERLPWIASPSASGDKVGWARKADPAGMVFPARFRKWPAANCAQGMADELDALSALQTEIRRIPSVNPAAARAAAGRIEPVNEPIETIGERTG